MSLPLTEGSPADQKTTPMMSQWHACKKMAKGAVLFFRMGDFYEAFYDDAIVLSRELDITLTKRQETPMAGVPCHTCDTHIDRLVAKGYRVAVAEQMEDPRAVKGLVKREVVRVVSPGTVIDSALLSDKNNNFFASITQVGAVFGFSYLDLTTGEFYVLEFRALNDLFNEIYRVRPAEIVVSPKFHEKHCIFLKDLKQGINFLLNEHDEWHFDHQITYDFLINQFKVHSLDGYGLKGMVAGINAGGALLQYLQDNLCASLGHIQEIQTYSSSQFMTLDFISQRNLELTESMFDGSRRNTLLEILDQTQTPMGARLMHHWIKQPLMSPEGIKERQDAIEQFYSSERVLDKFRGLLEGVRDIERLIMKISSGYASPRDLVALRFSLEGIPGIKSLLSTLPQTGTLLQVETEKLSPLPEVTQLIAVAIVDEPPARVSDGKIFREGYSRELDELREISRDSKTWLAQYQNNLREQVGIKTLKVGYTRMFGYYIEVSKGQADRMPDSFQRRQTLVNAERFISPELKDYESKILTAEDRISAIETELFNQVRDQITKYAGAISQIAHAIARLDVMQSLAYIALKNDYTRPFVDDSQSLMIKDGRHPVIEGARIGEKFIPNDTFLDDDKNRLLLITGPNMAGKSTYIRQVALITIMAQIGSFVPAKSTSMGIVDKVFTRIGASDDLSRGQSTFMVEMTETANILNNATDRSLVILDEIGRGTSTYDGISIAWSVAEYLLTAEGRMAKVLFATHYWELTKLEEKVPGAVNYNVAVHESEDHIVFLRKIVKGGTDKSYGIHVGRLAGLPGPVIARAKEILQHLEENANRDSVFEPSQPKRVPRKVVKNRNEMQMTFFG